MKFKLDENFGTRTQRAIVAEGHDVETVRQENLGGANDQTIFAACVREQRCLLTLDLDFADVVRFPPHESAGVAVFRLPKTASPALMDWCARRMLALLKTEAISRRLWIVEAGRIRIHADTAPEMDEG